MSAKWVAYNERDELVRAMAQIENMQAVVDAATAYVHAINLAHHTPYNRVKHWRANLIAEVEAYEENQQ